MATAPPVAGSAVTRQADRLAAAAPGPAQVAALDGGEPMVKVAGLVAGYGAMEILHGIDLHLGAGRSLCLIGPNGAGKSTVLHSIYGFTRISAGRIVVGGRDITGLPPERKLRTCGIAYVLQDSSLFPDMTVTENLLMGGYLLARPADARAAAARILEKYPRLAQRCNQRAAVLSGGERRLLEIARALIMDPRLLLVDEPSIGLEPRFIDLVFDLLRDLQRAEGRTIILVEQNARRGLEFADLGYVLVSGRVALAGSGAELLHNPEVGRLFLGA